MRGPASAWLSGRAFPQAAELVVGATVVTLELPELQRAFDECPSVRDWANRAVPATGPARGVPFSTKPAPLIVEAGIARGAGCDVDHLDQQNRSRHSRGASLATQCCHPSERAE